MTRKKTILVGFLCVLCLSILLTGCTLSSASPSATATATPAKTTTTPAKTTAGVTTSPSPVATTTVLPAADYQKQIDSLTTSIAGLTSKVNLLSAASGVPPAIQTEVTSMRTDLTRMDTSLVALTAKITNLTGGTDYAAKITAVETKDTALDGRITSLAAQVTTLLDKITKLEAGSVVASTAISSGLTTTLISDTDYVVNISPGVEQTIGFTIRLYNGSTKAASNVSIAGTITGDKDMPLTYGYPTITDAGISGLSYIVNWDGLRTIRFEVFQTTAGVQLGVAKGVSLSIRPRVKLMSPIPLAGTTKFTLVVRSVAAD